MRQSRIGSTRKSAGSVLTGGHRSFQSRYSSIRGVVHRAEYLRPTALDYCLPQMKRGTSSPRLVASGSGTQPDTNTPRRQQEIIVVNLSVGPPHELRQTLAGRQQEVEAGSEPVRSTRGSRELPHRLAATHSPSRFRTKASCVP